MAPNDRKPRWFSGNLPHKSFVMNDLSQSRQDARKEIRAHPCASVSVCGSLFSAFSVLKKAGIARKVGGRASQAPASFHDMWENRRFMWDCVRVVLFLSFGCGYAAPGVSASCAWRGGSRVTTHTPTHQNKIDGALVEIVFRAFHGAHGAVCRELSDAAYHPRQRR